MGNNGTLRQRRLGRDLRRLREAAGLSLEDAARGTVAEAYVAGAQALRGRAE